MHQLAVKSIQHIIRASFLMQPQGQRSVLIFVPKGKLHLIPVSKLHGTSLNPLEHVIRVPVIVHLPGICYGLIQHILNLLCLHFQLFSILHSLIHTAPAVRKNTAYRSAFLHGGFLQHFQKPSLQAVSPLFIYQKPYLLARNSVFHNHGLSIYHNSSLVGEVHFFDNSFVNFSFFQNYSSRYY